MNIFQEDRKSPHAKAFYSFVSLSNKIEMQMKKALKPFGMTHAQLNVLYLLARNHPRKMHPAELKRLLIVHNPDITRLLDRLVSKGWVHRQTCQENRRKVDLKITSEGLEIFEKAHYAAKASVGSFFSDDMSLEDIDHFRSLLKKISL